MKLAAPFFISARLAPALKVADAVLSYSRSRFVFDFADGTAHVVIGFRFAEGRFQGKTDERCLQDGFTIVLSELGACAESRSWAERQGKPAAEGENSDLFPEAVGAWAQLHSDEIGLLECELDEAPDLITEGQS